MTKIGPSSNETAVFVGTPRPQVMIMSKNRTNHDAIVHIVISLVVSMTEKLDPIKILNMIIADLENRSQNQDDLSDSVTLTKLIDKIAQVKKQYLFEIADHEYANIVR